MSTNYPIKYCLYPMIEKVGKNKDIGGYDVSCYIVSKCYLIGEEKKYTSDGNTKMYYDVVFPFRENENKEWFRDVPRINPIVHSCYNSFQVDQVFDTYEEALPLKNTKNDEIKKRQYYCRFLSVKEVKELEKKFDDKMNYYNLLEQIMGYETADLIKQDNTKVYQK